MNHKPTLRSARARNVQQFPVVQQYPTLEQLETRTLLSVTGLIALPDVQAIPDASTSSFQGYSPQQIRQAYSFSSVSGNGAGQTIAIVDAYNDKTIASDLAAFDSHFGLAPVV
jgi:subtilase family serine protease